MMFPVVLFFVSAGNNNVSSFVARRLRRRRLRRGLRRARAFSLGGCDDDEGPGRRLLRGPRAALGLWQRRRPVAFRVARGSFHSSRRRRRKTFKAVGRGLWRRPLRDVPPERPRPDAVADTRSGRRRRRVPRTPANRPAEPMAVDVSMDPDHPRREGRLDALAPRGPRGLGARLPGGPPPGPPVVVVERRLASKMARPHAPGRRSQPPLRGARLPRLGHGGRAEREDPLRRRHPRRRRALRPLARTPRHLPRLRPPRRLLGPPLRTDEERPPPHCDARPLERLRPHQPSLLRRAFVFFFESCMMAVPV
mmetsp:Transcript_24476/g.79043  ORF Transcript_24476/g.79043 Transcript_24476/m.79043 type:complete len:308 (-) Transcript_24476:498-1421(-)